MAVSNLTKENRSLKSHLGTLQSEIIQMKKTSTSAVSISTQCDFPFDEITVKSVVNEQNVVCMSDAPTTTASGNASSDPVPLNEDFSDVSQEGTPQQLSSVQLHNKDRVPVSVQNRFEVLSNLGQEQETANSQKTSHSPNLHNASEAPSQSPNLPPVLNTASQKKSPKQVLNDINIPTDTSSLLMGDSVIRHVNPKRLETHKDPMFKICVPGLTGTDLIQWLHGSVRHNQVNTVIVHVGVNDCPAGSISVSDWCQLIDQCKNSFPSAYIALSSILPAPGRNQLNNSIAPSNRNLYAACTNKEVDLIDNHGAFVTQNGAPRQALYKDATHPSMRGTASLAVNFKRVLPYPKRPGVSDSTDDVDHPRQTLGRQGHPESFPVHRVDRRHLYSNRTASRYQLCDNKDVGVPPMSSSAHFPPLSSRNASQVTFDKEPRIQPSQPLDSIHLGQMVEAPREMYLPSQVGQSQDSRSLHTPSRDPSFVPHPLPVLPPSGQTSLHAPYPRFPDRFPYHPLSAHGAGFSHQSLGPAAPGVILPQGCTYDTRSWLPSTQVDQYTQQLINLASQLAYQRDHHRPMPAW